MRSSFTVDRGLRLVRTPSPRQQAQRRRLVVIVAVVALGVGSGVFGALTAPLGQAELASHTGPFSYFPSE